MKLLLVTSEGEKVLFRLDDVVEVLPMLALSGAAEGRGRFRGLLNLRGQVVPVHDLSDAARPLAEDRFVVVSRLGEGMVGLVVDDVLDVVDLPLSEQSIGGGRTLVVAQSDQDLLTVLEPSQVLQEAS